MANTFTPATLNLNNGGQSVPLPGSATQFSGGVTPPIIPPTAQSYTPIAPLPVTGTGQVSTAI
jgi:hypothetical protein